MLQNLCLHQPPSHTQPLLNPFNSQLKDRYGATDREAADYMNTFYYEIGSKMSRENGIDAAFKHKTLRDAWKGELYQTLGLEGEPELKHLP